MNIKITEEQLKEILLKNIDADRYRGQQEVDGSRLDLALLMAIYKNRSEKDTITIV